MGQRINLNYNWYFTEKFNDKLLSNDCSDMELKQVSIPHTCKELPYHYFDESLYQMVSGYKKSFNAPIEWKDKDVVLTFDGIAHDSEIYLNGKKIAQHHCGYTACSVSLNDFLTYDKENVLVVKVDSRESLNIPPFGFVIDYMTYGGIYREAYITVYSKHHIADVFAYSQINLEKLQVEENGLTETSEATLFTEVTLSGINSDSNDIENITLRHSLIEKSNKNKKINLGSHRLIDLFESENKAINLSYEFKDIKLWNINNPELYELKTELLIDDNGNETVFDEYVMNFGFRDAKFKKDGFWLNGKKLKLRGLNRHQSYPYVGYAMPKSMQELDADILKNELGVNCVRTSHYPQSHHFLNRCDEIGLLVFTEIPGWQHIGDSKWKDQAVQNVADMVLQYRNHTSIILWGVRINESSDDDEFYIRTNETAHKLDCSRPTGGVRCIKNSHLFEDVYTYNDFVHNGRMPGCEPKKKVTSRIDKPYLISEYNGHMYPTKTFDSEEHRIEHAIRHANVLNAVAGENDIAGSFGWCMFDYNTHKDFGSGDRICYHGVMDMFRNPKMAAIVYACQQDEFPVLEISSSMDIGEHPGGNRGTIYIFSNADSVRMFKNNDFIKEYDIRNSTYKNLNHGPVILDDFIGDRLKKAGKFKPKQADAIKVILNAAARYGVGNLPKKIFIAAIKLMVIYGMKPNEAVTLFNHYVGDWGGSSTSYRFDAIKNGKIVSSVIKEPMSKVRLKVDVNKNILVEAETYDVASVRITAVDENDNLLPFFNDVIKFATSGSIGLIGPEYVALQGGMGGCYVRTNGKKQGTGTLTIHNENTDAVEIEFETRHEENVLNL